jgi:hypothetical protein
MDFITLAEAYFNRRLRVREMQTSETTTTVVGAYTLPADFLAWIEVVSQSGSDNRVLEYVDNNWADATGFFEAGSPHLAKAGERSRSRQGPA